MKFRQFSYIISLAHYFVHNLIKLFMNANMKLEIFHEIKAGSTHDFNIEGSY